VRVVEQFSILDHLSDGRAMLGLGRGLGRQEFVGLRVNMAESRRRFTEYTEAILVALETGVMEYDGELYRQPRVEIRPKPYKSFRGRTFASAISPYSIDLMARLGVGLLVIAQKPWDTVETELAGYRDRYRELNGEEGPKPIINVFVGVHEDPAEAQRIRDVYLQATAKSISDHYEFSDPGFAKIEGYEYYAKLAANIARHGEDNFNSFLADLQVWGTPDQVTEKLLEYVRRSDAGGLLATLSFGGMSPAEAARNFELYSREVQPVLKAHDVGGDVGVTYASTAITA
jgi:alkanesulfonate monooxygenase SsuD/methylene tetrahydromethanopterin reductase-like flavin-dependent oxidoreductase (luciferase family)